MHTDGKISLNMAIERLTSNEAQWTHLRLDDIIINPRTVYHLNFPMVVSRIGDNDLIALSEAIATNKTLTHVYINGTDSTCKLRWTEQGALAIGNALKHHPTVEYLKIDLTCLLLEPDHIIGFLDALTGTAPLTHFSLKVHNSDDSLHEALANSLNQNHSLKSIRYRANSTASFANKTLSQLFIQSFFFEKTLRRLTLTGISLDNVDMTYLAKLLANAHSIRTLSLKNIAMTDNGLELLTHALLSNKNLTELDLSNNALELSGIKCLIKTLPSLKQLQNLSLRETVLNEDVTQYFADEWRNKEFPLRIPYLDLSHNKINAKIIHKLIDGNIYLKHLRVDFCELNDRDIKLLFPLLANPQRCHLELLSIINYHSLNSKTYNKLLKILKKNPLIQIHPPLDYKYKKKFTSINSENIKTGHQQKFFTYAIELANANTSPSTTNFSALPGEIILIILSMLYEDTVENIDTSRCMHLVLNNFAKRRKLIEEGQYIPNENPTIGEWWDKTTTVDNKLITQFKSHKLNSNLFFTILPYEEPQELEVSKSKRCNLM